MVFLGPGLKLVLARHLTVIMLKHKNVLFVVLIDSAKTCIAQTCHRCQICKNVSDHPRCLQTSLGRIYLRLVPLAMCTSLIVLRPYVP